MNRLSCEKSCEKAVNGCERLHSPNDRPSAGLDELIIARLEDAGRVLLALPWSGYRTGTRSGHPEVVNEAIESYGWSAPTMRPAVPSAARISKMDEALSWITLIPIERSALRRVVGRRMLVHPINDRHLYSWRDIGRDIGVSHQTAKNWHAEAVGMIAAELRIKFAVSV